MSDEYKGSSTPTGQSSLAGGGISEEEKLRQAKNAELQKKYRIMTVILVGIIVAAVSISLVRYNFCLPAQWEWFEYIILVLTLIASLIKLKSTNRLLALSGEQFPKEIRRLERKTIMQIGFSFFWCLFVMLSNVETHIRRNITGLVILAACNYCDGRELFKKVTTFMQSIIGATKDSWGLIFDRNGVILNPKGSACYPKNAYALILPSVMMLCVSFLLCILLLTQLTNTNQTDHRRLLKTKKIGYLAIALMGVYIASFTVYLLVGFQYGYWTSG